MWTFRPANSDLMNLLASIEIAVVMLAPDVTIRRFTPQAQTLLGLIPGDIGRPFFEYQSADTDSRFAADGTEGDRDVAERGERSEDGRAAACISCGSCPYRTPEGKLEGAVLMLVDVTLLEADKQKKEQNSG